MPKCVDCVECKAFGHRSFQCLVREGRESGRGESNIHADDEVCKDFKARKCDYCGQATERGRRLCSDCYDLQARLRMDSREDGGVVSCT